MPRLSPADFIAQQKQTPKATSTPRAGFDATKFRENIERAASDASILEEGGVTRETQTVGSRFKDLLGGAVYGVSGVGRGAQRLAAKGIEKVTGKDITNYQSKFGEIQGVSDKAGFEESGGVDLDTRSGKTGEFLGEVAKYANPARAGVGLTGLALRGSAAGATEAISNDGVDSSTGVTAGIAAFAPPVVSGAAKVFSKLFTNAIKGTGGVIGGKGTKVIDEIYKNPKAAREGLREAVSLSEDATKIRQGVQSIAKKASDEFAEDLAALPKRIGKAPKVLTDKTKTTIKTGGKTYTLSKQGVKSSLTQSLRQFDVNVNPKKKVFDFSESPLSRTEEKVLREVLDVVDQWKDTTPVGFHKLARKVSNYRRAGEQSAELNAIIDSTSRNINGYIGKRIPAAKTMLNKYSKAQDVIEAFDQEFATKGKFIGGAAENIKTERKVGNLFSGEKTSATKLLSEQMREGADITARQAGRLMSEQVPRNASSIGDMLRGVVNAVVTPKMVGEVAAFLGIAAPKAERLLARLATLDPAARAVVIATVADLMESEPQE